MALVATVLIASVDAKEIGGALQRERSMKTRDTERTDGEEGRVDGMGWDGGKDRREGKKKRDGNGGSERVACSWYSGTGIGRRSGEGRISVC